MKFTYSSFAAGMVWLTLPLMVGLGYWEHNLALPNSGHTLVQLLLLPLLFGWTYFWNTQVEIDQLHHIADHQAAPKPQARLIIGAAIDKQMAGSPEIGRSQTSKEITQSTPLETRYHGTNN